MKKFAALAVLTISASVAVAIGRVPAGSADGEPAAPAGFRIETIAHIDQPRELAVAPNGDLFVGTSSSAVMIVPGAEGTPGTPETFATLPDAFASGVALAPDALFVGTHAGVWRIPYATGDRRPGAAPKRLAAVRPGNQGGHATTSVAVTGDRLFVAVGSSCNACEEHDPTRATIHELSTQPGAALQLKAKRIRNAIALAVDPATHDLWAGVAGQDDLEHAHPYEIFDDVSAHAGVADYAWPHCYEDRRPVAASDSCANAALPLADFPAYETPIGAAFYTTPANARYAFGAAYRGGAFVALHGSWHMPPVPPRVVFVPFANGKPKTAIDWSDPNAQWKPFLEGFQKADGSRIGRPTGVAVGTDGSLFVADDEAGVVYRIRPAAVSGSASRPRSETRS